LTDTPPAAVSSTPRGTAAMQADPATWQPLAPGVDVWERRAYFDAKGNGI
jgi:hypothetical protein